MNRFAHLHLIPIFVVVFASFELSSRPARAAATSAGIAKPAPMPELTSHGVESEETSDLELIRWRLFRSRNSCYPCTYCFGTGWARRATYCACAPTCSPCVPAYSAGTPMSSSGSPESTPTVLPNPVDAHPNHSTLQIPTETLPFSTTLPQPRVTPPDTSKPTTPAQPYRLVEPKATPLPGILPKKIMPYVPIKYQSASETPAPCAVAKPSPTQAP